MKNHYAFTFLCMLLLLFSFPAYAANPTVEEVDEVQAVTFNGVDTFLKSTFPTDARYTSSNAWTVITKVYNPSIAAQEITFNWGYVGVAYTTAAQSYGNQPNYGAMEHYTGEGNMGFDGGVPDASTL